LKIKIELIVFYFDSNTNADICIDS